MAISVAHYRNLDSCICTMSKIGIRVIFCSGLWKQALLPGMMVIRNILVAILDSSCFHHDHYRYFHLLLNTLYHPHHAYRLMAGSADGYPAAALEVGSFLLVFSVFSKCCQQC